MKKFTKKIEPYLFLLPALVLLGLFVYYPFGKTVIGSFFLVDRYGDFSKFIGLKNYLRLFSDKGFYQALFNTLKHLVMMVPATIGLSLALALISDKKSRFSRIYETLFCLSMAVSTAVAGKIFQMLFNPSLGIINSLFGLDISWLTDKRYALPALTVILIWTELGFSYIYLTAAIRNLPEDVLESADVEGAGRLQKIFKIILPLISPSLFYLFCTLSVSSMIMVRLVLILTQGGPAGSTETLIYRMYNMAYNNSNYSSAYALGVVVFVMVLALMFLNFRMEKRSVFYE